MACRVVDETPPFTDADLEKIIKKIGDNMNSACTGYGQCEKLCTQHLPIIERLKEIASGEKK
jgi:predicted aldo/keto reductase-like oxidoreductase